VSDFLKVGIFLEIYAINSDAIEVAIFDLLIPTQVSTL
jgi:hypothetical protein